MPRKSLYLSGDTKADTLLTKDPLALLIGMVLDQQIPLEWAFRGPAEMTERLGFSTPLDAAQIASMDPDKLAAAFSERPAIHRYPGSMAGRVQAMCQVIVDEYQNKPASVWKTAKDGKELFRRVHALPGFGEMKARIFVALLGKQLGVQPTGWVDASEPFGETGSFRSVADIVDAESMATVRQRKAEAKAAAKAAKAAAAGSSTPTPAARPAGAADRLAGRRLYLCTPDRPDLADFVEACIAGGVDIVQLREKALDARPLLQRAALVRDVCRAHAVPFILNDRPDLALEAGADGVHVGQDDAPPHLARRILGPDAIIGYSTHAPAELEAAVSEPVDYLSAGPVEPTPTKPGRPGTGLSYAGEATRRSPLPVYVTGGVTPATVPALAQAGVERFVVVRWLTQADTPETAARALRTAIDEALG